MTVMRGVFCFFGFFKDAVMVLLNATESLPLAFFNYSPKRNHEANPCLKLVLKSLLFKRGPPRRNSHNQLYVSVLWLFVLFCLGLVLFLMFTLSHMYGVEIQVWKQRHNVLCLQFECLVELNCTSHKDIFVFHLLTMTFLEFTTL